MIPESGESPVAERKHLPELVIEAKENSRDIVEVLRENFPVEEVAV